MTSPQFDKFLEESQELQRQTLASKKKEYATEDDRFQGFKLIAEMARVPVNFVFRVLMAKHLVSVIKILSGELPNNPDLRQEKFGDSANYLELGKAWLADKANKNNSSTPLRMTEDTDIDFD